MKKAIKPIQRLFRLLKLNREEIYRIYFFAIFIGVVNLGIPLGIQGIVNFIQMGTVSSSWIFLSVLVILGVALAGGLQILQLRITENIQQNIFVRSAFELAHRIPRFRFDQMKKFYGPELLNRFFDTVAIQKGVAKLLLDFTTSALQVVLALILLSFYHPFFIVFGVVLVMLIFSVFKWTHPKGMETSLDESNFKYKMANWLEELARTYSSFKLVGKSNLPLKVTDRHAMNYLNARQKHFKVLVSQFAFMVGIKVIVTAALLILGGILVMEQQMNLGQFVAAEIIILLILNSVEKLMRSVESAYDTLTGLEKIGFITDMELDDESSAVFAELEHKPMSVELHDLFLNTDNGERILENINLVIPEGSKTFITGTSNSGKTMLLRVLSGLIPIENGQLIFNGRLNLNLGLSDLRERIGDYYSEEEIFNGTLWENITMGRENLDKEFILQLSKRIGLDEFVLKNKLGYSHFLLHRGQNLPESIRKKVLLLRSMASKPNLLIIEDTFGNLNFAERDQLYSLLENLPFETTLVFLSNNVKQLKKADNIYVLKEGKVNSEGSFDEVKKVLMDLKIIENA